MTRCSRRSTCRSTSTRWPVRRRARRNGASKQAATCADCRVLSRRCRTRSTLPPRRCRELEAAQEFERDGEALRRSLTDADAHMQRCESRVDELERALKAARLDLKQADDDRASVAQELKHWEQTPERPDLDALRAKLAAVDETNAAVRARSEYARVAEECAAAETAQAAANRELEAIEKRKRDGLAAATFPVAGLSVDENGVTFDGVPFTQVNSAMRRRVAFAIATAGDPKLRLVIVKDGDLLDADSLAAIRELADERGYTVLVERDRDESRQIGFTIEDGALAEVTA